MFFYNTTADYAGKGTDPGSEQVNFADFREGGLSSLPKELRVSRRTLSGPTSSARRKDGSEASRRSPVPGTSCMSASAPSGVAFASDSSAASGSRGPRTRRWSNLTAYTQQFGEKPSDGAKIDSELRAAIAASARGQDRAPAKGRYASCYNGMCGDQARGHSGLEPAYFEEDNGMRYIIGPTADAEGCPKDSFASSQHGPPAKELIFAPTTYSPRDQIGRVPKAADFFSTASRRTYSGSAIAQAPPPPLQRASSAPSGLIPGLCGGSLRAAAEEHGPEHVFRQAMMTSQYGQTINRRPAVAALASSPPPARRRGSSSAGSPSRAASGVPSHAKR